MNSEVKHRGRGVPWPSATREKAISRAQEVGVIQAAQECQIPEVTLRSWLKNTSAPKVDRVVRAQYDDVFRQAAVKLATEVGVKVAATSTNVPYQTLVRWVRSPDRRRTLNTYTQEFRLSAIALVSQTSLKEACESLGLKKATLGSWVRESMPEEQRRRNRSYSAAEVEEAVRLAKEMGVIRAADRLGISENTVRKWSNEATPGFVPRKKKTAPRSYSEDSKRQALELAQTIGVPRASHQLDINASTLRRWAGEAEIDLQSERGNTKGWDTSLPWLTKSWPAMEDWRSLAEQWLHVQSAALPTRITALIVFFEDYIVGQGLTMVPEELLSRFFDAPDPGVAFPDTPHGKTCRNNAADFLDWVILTLFGNTDAGGQVVLDPLFRNPLSKASFAGDDIGMESVYDYLPHDYLEECRRIIAQGPIFRDWTWAQSQLGVEVGAQGGVAPEWFEVPYSFIDTGDPDCVWRRRVRSLSSGGPIYEIWSPVRWVAQLVKVTLVLRTHQVRMLDSGESDTWQYCIGDSGGTWILNDGPLRSGTVKKPTQQGVFRRPSQNLLDRDFKVPANWPNAVLYINTNKTADAKKSGAQKGYSFPWLVSGGLESDVFYWMAKLRDWQKRYNPLSRPTSWSELDSRHITKKSDGQLAGFPDTCFLFRLPEERGGKRHLPLSKGMLTHTWYAVLEELEGRLKRDGKTHADGSPIRLVDSTDRKAKRTFFPPHSVRVSIATALAEAGLPLSVLMRIMGHARMRMTSYYHKRGQVEMAGHLEVALETLKTKGAELLTNWLKNAQHSKLLEGIVSNDDNSLLSAIPKNPAVRNQIGWMPMSNGMCAVGGNVSAVEDRDGGGGCYNGGPNIGSVKRPKFAPVPGGAKNCVRCRWFFTAAHYLPALVDHCNVVLFHLYEARLRYLAAERTYQDLVALQIQQEESNGVGPTTPEIDDAKRKVAWALQHFTDRVEDLAATMRLIDRCRNLLTTDSERANESRKLLAVGRHIDIETALHDVSSEFEQLDTVCDAIEIYPEVDAPTAVLRRSQLIDAALAIDGAQPISFALSIEDQLRVNNELMRRLGGLANPENPKHGKRKVIEIVDARKSLSAALNIDIKGLAASFNSEPLVKTLAAAL